MPGKGYRKVITLGVNFTEFTGSADAVSRKLKVLDSEFAKAATSAAVMGDNTDKLGVRQEYLRQKVALQSQVVDKLATEYDMLNARYGENDKATEKALIAYNKAEKQMTTLKGQLEKTTQEVNNNKSAFVKLGTQMADVAEKAKKAGDTMQTVGTGLTAGVTAPIMAAGAAMLKSADDVSKYADEIGVMSEQTGMSAKQLQEMRYVSNQLDVDFNAVTTTMGAFTNKMRGADEGSGAAAKAMARLGISMKDAHGQTKPLNDMYSEAITKLSKMTNESDRNMMASTLFGKSWQQIAPLLAAGGDEIARLSSRANELGLVMSDESIGSAREFGDRMDEIKMQFEGVTRSLGVAFLPLLEDLMGYVQESVVPGFAKFAERVSGIVEWFANLNPVLQKIILSVIGLVAAVGPILLLVGKIASSFTSISTFLTAFNPAALKTTAIVLGVVAALIALAAVIAVLSGKSGEMERTFNTIGTGVQKVQSGVANASRSTPAYASGTDWHPGGQALVGDNGPEIVSLPMGSRVTPVTQQGGDTFNLYVRMDEVGEVSRLVQTVKQLKQTRRASGAWG